jgi:glycerol-3-phosphate dehydrogenase
VTELADAYDLLIIGAGINGAGIARDAAGRGLAVAICDKGDLGGATSSASSKLIHGGLRYLEYYEFRLVREALSERERLLAIAPHIAWPLRFVLPHMPSMRPWWLVRLGLFLYDHLDWRRMLPATAMIDLATSREGDALKNRAGRAFVYSDAWVDDARLVVLNCRDAADRGAVVMPRMACVEARIVGDRWVTTLSDTVSGASREIAARALVNAAGPWVDRVGDNLIGRPARYRARMVKGSHIVIRKRHAGDHAFVLQNHDRRIVFVVPFEEDFLIVGTTDVPYAGDPGDVAITSEETTYLLDVFNAQFRDAIGPADIVWSYSGVRPLREDESDDPSAVSRDYSFDLQTSAGSPPLLSIYGGKITTYRNLAEHALDELVPHLPAMGAAWSATKPLPGGDFPAGGARDYAASLLARHPWLGEARARRFARCYGTRSTTLIGEASCVEDLGQEFGAGLTAREVDFLRRSEWAQTAEDILWRRTKLGLRLDATQIAALKNFL